MNLALGRFLCVVGLSLWSTILSGPNDDDMRLALFAEELFLCLLGTFRVV